MTTELELMGDLDRTPTTLFASPDPAAIVAQATRIAEVIKPLIKERNLYKRIGQSDHVYIDAWTLTGSMLGVFATTVRTWEVGDNEGAGACVEARTINGAVVGRAEAVVMRDEEVGGKRKWLMAPRFQLISMAQTRASSKALRMPLGFVMQLAGYDATPAEEMEAAAARGETVTGGRGVAPGWRDISEQQRAHADLGVLIDEHGLRQWVAEYLASKGYERPLAKGQLNQLRRAIDREVEQQSGGGSVHSSRRGSTPPPDPTSDPVPSAPPGPGSDPTSPPPTSPGTAGRGGDHTSGGDVARASAWTAAPPDPNPAAVPLEGDEPAAATPPSRGGEALAQDPDNEQVGPAPALGGQPATSGPTPSPVGEWCDANNVQIRLAKVHLRKVHSDEFGDLKDWRDLEELRGERAQMAINYLDAWHHAGQETS
jgi:hypothetical protein